MSVNGTGSLHDSRWVWHFPSWYSVLSHRERRFWWLCLLLFVVVFSPSKAAGQMATVLFIVGLLFWVQLLPQKHFARYVLLFLGYTALVIGYFLFLPNFSFINHYLFLLTISGALLLLYDFRPIASRHLLYALSKLVLVILLLQGVYGVMQGLVVFNRVRSFDAATGDFVRGTIDPSFGSNIAASNQIFAILMTTLLLFAFATQPLQPSLQRIFTYGVALGAWLIASVFHTFIFFSIAVMVSFPILLHIHYHRPYRSPLMRSVQTVIFLGGLVFVLGFIVIALPHNLSTLPHFIENNLKWENGSDKALVTYNTFTRLPQAAPLQPTIGLGPGQYSSRAALIRTGEYLRGSNIPLPSYISPATDIYIMSLWRTFDLRHPLGGSTYFPYYSWLSLYGEMGIIGLLVVLIWFVRNFYFWRKLRTIDFPYMSRGIVILLIYVAMLGFQDNYWEFTQALTPAFLFLALGKAYARRIMS